MIVLVLVPVPGKKITIFLKYMSTALVHNQQRCPCSVEEVPQSRIAGAHGHTPWV